MLHKRIAIIHPWLPQYRTQFFLRLEQLLKQDGVELHVYYGDTPPEWAARNDTDAGSIGAKLPTRFFSLGGRSLVLKSIRQLIAHAPYDALILEQAVRNLETYGLILRGRRLAQCRAYWGHGRTYTENRSPLEERLKLELTKRSDWFFGYTPAGVRHLVDNGFPAARTTVVLNSMDSAALAESLANVTAEEVAAFDAEHDLHGKTALYIGGLDAAKRLDFLLESADYAHSRDPLFRLLVVGAGSQSEWLKESGRSRPWLKILGASSGYTKCLAFHAAQLLAIPGRVGLVAVDSLATGVPIITTKWPFHAPEFEYLESGRTCYVANNTVEDYGTALLRTLNSPELLAELSTGCKSEAPRYTIENMASNFAEGVGRLLSAGPVR